MKAKQKKRLLLFKDFTEHNKRNDKTKRRSVCFRNSYSHEKVKEKSVVVQSV